MHQLKKKKKAQRGNREARVPPCGPFCPSGWVLIHLLTGIKSRKAIHYFGFTLEVADFEIIGESSH